MGATSTSSSTIVYHVLPGCKGWHVNLAGQYQMKQQQNKPNPAGICNPIAVMYIPVCENRVQMESVSYVDSLSISKGIIGSVLLSRYW